MKKVEQRTRGAAGNRAAQATLKDLQRVRQEQHDEDLKQVLASPVGRRFVWWLIDRAAGAFNRSFAATEAHTNFNEGRRHVGLLVMTEAQRVSRADYVHMLDESLASQQEADRFRKHADAEAQTDVADEDRGDAGS